MGRSDRSKERIINDILNQRKKDIEYALNYGKSKPKKGIGKTFDKMKSYDLSTLIWIIVASIITAGFLIAAFVIIGTKLYELYKD